LVWWWLLLGVVGGGSLFVARWWFFVFVAEARFLEDGFVAVEGFVGFAF